MCLHASYIHVCVHAYMCICAHACMHGCILCVHTNVDVSIYQLQVYEFMYPIKSVICRSCICVQFILIHLVCFVLSLTLNMLVVTLRSLVIDAIKNILNLNFWTWTRGMCRCASNQHQRWLRGVIQGWGLRSLPTKPQTSAPRHPPPPPPPPMGIGRYCGYRSICQIQCICSISHNAPFRAEMCTFLLWMVLCGIWNRCLARFVN